MTLARRFLLLIGMLCALRSPVFADSGAVLYQTNCSSCHGVDLKGTAQGPSLEQSGAAAVDFMLTTGRMPVEDPTRQAARQPPKFDAGQIEALESFITARTNGGPPIPHVDNTGNLPRGRELFASNCEACHSAGGVGNAIGYGAYAPSLMHASVEQVAEAIRVGPGEMPRFDQRTLPQRDLLDVVRYVNWLQTQPYNYGGFSLGQLGPVAEGFIAGVVGLGLLVLVIRFIGTPT